LTLIDFSGNFEKKSPDMCGRYKYEYKYRYRHGFGEPNENWSKEDWQKYRQRSVDHDKDKFYKHLTWYLAVNAFLTFSGLRNGTIFGAFPVAIFWGIGLFFHYVKVFGWPSDEHPWFGGGRDDDDDDKHQRQEPKDEEPKWKDKDLV
jgi:2TM domain